MIKTRKDLRDYIKSDICNNIFGKHSLTKKYIITLRKTEFHSNTRHRLRFVYWYLRYRSLSNKYLTFIPLNVFGPGLSIAHLGGIYIGAGVKCGENVRISQNVTIGSTNGSDVSPRIGNRCFIGPHSCLIGDITIADDVCVAAGSVVVESILEGGVTFGGVPAKKISGNDSHSNIPIFNKKK